ncbi:MAG: hypothetical protein ABL900_10705 [Burkholderiaceae bacterium]
MTSNQTRHFALALACVFALGALPALCFAQTSEAERNAELYLESVVIAKRGPLCAARIGGFAERFEPAFAHWRARMAPRLNAGEAFLRAAAHAEKADFAEHVSNVTDAPARRLGKASQNILETNCEILLRRIAAP